jgi:inorganic pyrophosphatase
MATRSTSLVIGDEPAGVGCIVDMRILSDIEAEQTERGRTFRNAPLIGSVALSVSYEHDNHVDDLSAPFVDHS